MTFLTYFDFSLSEFLLILFIVFIASIIRGFNGFGFSATCISGFSFIIPAIQIVPIILILEVFISIFMIPYIWNKIDWNFVFKLLIGIAIGSPIGLYLLKYLSTETTHLYVCLIIIFFSILLMRGYINKKINNNQSKIFTGIISGTLNGLTTLGGMPVALFLINLFTSGMSDTHALKIHLIESVPYFRYLMMGLGLLLIMRYRPKGILPEKIEIK